MHSSPRNNSIPGSPKLRTKRKSFFSIISRIRTCSSELPFSLLKKKRKKVTLTFVVADVAKHHIRRQQRSACILPRGRIRTEIFRDVGRHCDGLQEKAEEAGDEEKMKKEEKENEEISVERHYRSIGL